MGAIRLVPALASPLSSLRSDIVGLEEEPIMPEPTPRDQMARMITGYWVSQMVHVAARLGLADRLADGPKTADELATATGTHARALYRLLRALASVGVFSEGGDRRVTQTPPPPGLRGDVPRSPPGEAALM